MIAASLTKQNNGAVLDATDRKILALLQDNAKISQAELAKAVGLTAPSVNERIRKLERGGVIRFKVDQDRIRLEINVAAAQRSRLRISSQLLKLARIVEPGMGS